MSEPSGKRLKTGFPICKTHRTALGSRAKQNFPTVVEAKIFEQDDQALPHVAAFFQRESEREQERAEAMMEYLNERGGQYCSKDIQRPGCESVVAVLQALELTLAQWKEAEGLMVELVQCAREGGDPHTASVVKARFLRPLVPRVKALGDLLTSARKAGCSSQGPGGMGEYLFDQLQEGLSSA
ncbi:ferritin light chain, oocyte isoform-like isoform X2 [Conger conger]|uniref:ferritin light chain, oocyte isoform-like isoform X2 n=1 Tax=Conger conger TaxID=82655 RepID=UPI002A59880D|nr:ferritin light chain, oocyte isoform-like isoform X2 [Conger conger]